MQKELKTVERDGYNGVYWPNPNGSRCGVILMLGDDAKDTLAKGGAKWLHQRGVNVLTMSPAPKDYGHHNYPLERFEKAIAFLKAKGNEKLGIVGASTTGMLALVAASLFPELTLTIAISPSDFVMEGFYQDGKDGARERPGDGESSVSYHGEPLPYLPYAYRHPEYWKKIAEESKRRGAMIASRGLFDESERRHPLQEAEKIQVENIRGRLILIGAEDDVLWDTCKYIRRMEARLQEKPHECREKILTYAHGTHFLFPQSMLTGILPVGSDQFVGLAFREAKEFPKECKEAREDLDRKLSVELTGWAAPLVEPSERKAASKTWYDAHAVTVFSKNGYWKGDYRATLSVLAARAPASLIDIGCGPGAFLACAAEALPETKLCGMDLSEGMARAASERLGARARIRQGDAEKMPLESEQFEALTCNLSIHHYPHAQNAVNEMYRVLKPGGMVCINDMDCAAPIRALANRLFPLMKSGDVKMYRRDEIETMLQRAGFRVVFYYKLTPFTFLCAAVKE